MLQINGIVDAVAYSFAFFYVLWLEYPTSLECTWQFIQRLAFAKTDGSASSKLQTFMANFKQFRLSNFTVSTPQ